MNPALSSVIVVPFLGSLYMAVAPRRQRAQGAAIILALTFAASLVALRAFILGAPLGFSRYLAGWFSLSFRADGLAVFMAAVSSFVGLLIALYAREYMKDYEDSGVFYFWMVFFVASMMGLIFSANLLVMFCFWELTSACSWRLIGFYRKEQDLKAADKSFLVTFFGASLFLAGAVLVYLSHGTLEFSGLKGTQINNLAAFLLLAGIISKSAQLPLQTWLPDAGVAPTPVTALLHAAVLVKIGVYAFARIFNLTLIAGGLFTNVVVFISITTILVAAASALVENNMKRILAYSTISQLGYIILAFALRSDIALKTGLVYILAHSLAKAGLFLCAGIVEHKTGTKNINELGGLARKMPLVAAAYLLCAFSIIGLPPFLGFWPKFMTVLLAAKAGYVYAAFLAVLAALFTLFYLMRLYNAVFLGDAVVEVREEAGSAMVWVVLVLGGLSLFSGLFVRLPFDLVSVLMR